MSSSPGEYRILPTNRPHTDSPATSVEKESQPTRSQEVVLISLNMSPGPIGHAIYALPLPPPISDNSTPILRQQQNSEVYPILEIPSSVMREPYVCCVKLKSRLYYVGGMSFGDVDCMVDYLSRVYYVELDHLYAYASAAAYGETRPPASALLREGVPMSSGKRNCYAFVVEDKLYAIGMDHSYAQFEVFDPDTDKWSILAEPPFAARITSHAVIGNRLILSTSRPDLSWPSAYFHITNQEWVRYRSQRPFQSYIPALFVRGSLYTLSNYTISSYGPSTTSVEDDEDFSKLFDDLSIASFELSDVIDIEPTHSSRLLHLGNNTLLYVMEIPYWISHDEPMTLRLVSFEVTGKTRLEPPPKHDFGLGGGTRYFQTKHVRSLDYVCGSKSGAVFHSSYINGCFFGSAIA